MIIILRTFIFLTANAIGFASIALAFHFAQLQGTFSSVSDANEIAEFFRNTMFAWAAGAIISIG